MTGLAIYKPFKHHIIMTHYLKSFVMLLLSFPFIVSCESYDDKDLWDAVNSLDDRVTSIEKQLETLNGDIQTVSTLVELLRTRTYVTKVTDKGDGYDISFSDGSKVSISDGKDGENAPVINVKLYGGKYYWTQTINGQTTWLLDGNGQKLPVSGEDAVTPLLKIDSDGYWIVSYDSGKSYSTLLNEKGESVKASGEDGDSFFNAVDVTTDELRIELKDGTELVIPIGEQPLYKAVDLGLSVKWSSKNLGATLPSDIGEYYLWGDADNTGVIAFYEAPNVNNICGTEYDIVRAMWGGTWRMPSRGEFMELVSSCTWTKATVNGTEGMKVIGPNKNSIFLPNTGCLFPASGVLGTTQLSYENEGHYWCGNSYLDTYGRFAYTLQIRDGSIVTNRSWNVPFCKCVIRPVKDK